MAIGNRPYQITPSPDHLAEGPPFVQATLLLVDYAYDLLQTLQKWEAKLDDASGELILLVASGDSELSGALYRKLRTVDRTRADAKANRQYRKRLQAMSGIPRAEIQINSENTLEIAERLGVDVGQLPCIVWSTYPDMRPPLITPIKQAWCQDEHSRNQFARVFATWLLRARYQSLMHVGTSVSKLRTAFKRHIGKLATALDETHGISSGRKRHARNGKTTALLTFPNRDEPGLRSDRPAELRITPDRTSHSPRISRTQLFYLSAFLLLGVRSKTATGGQIRVTEKCLANRLEGWIRAELRKRRSDTPQKAESQVFKGWRRFAGNMNDRLGSNDWFDEGVRGKDDGNRFYSCSVESVLLTMSRAERLWLREQLQKLTGQT